MNDPNHDTDPTTEFFGAPVYTYSRKQAIEDGVLVDLMQEETVAAVREAGFKYPVAMTVGAWTKCIGEPDQPLPPGQDLQGRLWDVLWMLRCAVRNTPSTPLIGFELFVRNARNHLERVKLWSKCGPGDTAEPVITIMLPGED